MTGLVDVVVVVVVVVVMAEAGGFKRTPPLVPVLLVGLPTVVW